MTKTTLSQMTLDELHDEGERLGSNVLLDLDRTVAEMDDAERDGLIDEVRVEAVRALAEADALEAEGKRA